MKKLYACLLTAALFFTLSAVPGIKSSIPDESGQFIYYRDYTFQDETYVGVLRYDEGTYCMRYLSKGLSGKKKDISIYLTMNTSSDFIDLTGETVIGATSADDTDALNYMHDVLYEFAGRRKKVNSEDLYTSFVKKEDYPQFGGTVKIVYDGYIPLFNISGILSESGETLLEPVCTGVISSSADTMFSGFSGVVDYIPESTYDSTDQEPAGYWTELSDNIWALGDDAIFMMRYTGYDEKTFSEVNGFSILDYYARYFITSSDGSYIYLNNSTFLPEDDTIFLIAEVFNTESGEFNRNIRCLGRIDSDYFDNADSNYSYFYLYELMTRADFYQQYEEYLLNFISEMMP